MTKNLFLIKKIVTTLVAGCCCLLAGCVPKQTVTIPEPYSIPMDWHTQSQALLREPALSQWWREFEDDQLNGLIDRAFADNSDIRASIARLREAKSLGRATATIRWPSLDLGASTERTRRENDSGATRLETDHTLGLSGEWSLDLFGQNALQISAAEQAVVVAQAQARAVVLATLNAVISEYYHLRGLQQRIVMTERSIELLKASLTFIEKRFLAGESSEFDVVRVRAEYQLAQSRLPELEAQITVSLNRLAVLTQNQSDSLALNLGDAGAFPLLSRQVRSGLPASLLKRRPDVMLAQAQADASLIDYDLSVAQLYPTISLRAGMGLEGESLGDLVSLPNRAWSLGAFLDWPLFALKTKKALSEAAFAQAQARLIEFEGVALSAVVEVQSALQMYLAALDKQARLHTVVQTRERAWEMAQEVFNVGETSFLSVLDAERELVASRDDLVDARIGAVESLLELYSALGGGWEYHSEVGVKTSHVENTL